MNARSMRRAIVIVAALQALVLVLLPLLAGQRVPSGTTVVLAAAVGKQPGFAEEQTGRQELWLEYDFDELDVPDAIDAGDMAFVRVEQAATSDPVQLGPVVEDPAKLPDDSIWIKLPTVTSRSGDARVDAGPIQAWFDDDADRSAKLHEELDEGDPVLVTLELGNDGDPTIQSVRLPE